MLSHKAQLNQIQERRRKAPRDAFELAKSWLAEQIPLAEAVLVALSIHVVAFPIIWIAGWSLPWPKTPPITTVVDYNLEKWLYTRRPEQVFDYYDPEQQKKH